MTGSIRKREVVEVFSSIMRKNNIPEHCYSFKAGEMHVLVGSRIVSIEAKARMAYYALKRAEREVEKICATKKAADSNKNQIDLEEAIAAKVRE